MQKELELLTKFENDVNWFYSNYENLREEFPDKFVAIENNEVIEKDDELEKVIEKLKARGKNPAQVLIKFLSKEKITILY